MESPVPAAAPAPSAAPMSFDQIEASQEAPAKTPEKQERKRPTRRPEPVDDDEMDGLNDEDDNDSDEELEDSDADEATDATDDPEDDAEESDDPFETIKQEFDDKGRVSVTVNGKEKKFTVAELKNIAASGAHTLEVRQKLTQDIQKITREKEQISKADEIITPAYRAIKEGKLEDAFLEIASSAGKSKLEVKRELREQFIPVVAEWLGLDAKWVAERLNHPQIRQHHDILKTKEENAHWKSEAERQKAAQAKSAKQNKQIPGFAEMRKIQSERGFSDSAITEAVKLLKESGEVAGNEPAFPVEKVVGKLEDIRAVDRAIDAISAIKPKLVENEKFLDGVIAQIRRNPDLDNAALGKLIRRSAETFASKQVEDEATQLTKEVSRKSLQGKDKSRLKAPIQQGQTKSRSLSFRDYESELESGLP
jgi:ribosomal protein L39E